MNNINNIQLPDSLGEVQNRYMWEGTRHHILNHVLFLLCLAIATISLYIAQSHGYTLRNSTFMQCIMTFSLTLGVFFMLRAIQDQMLRHIRFLAIVGDRGFSILKYNEENDVVVEEYTQPYESLSHIEKHERDDISEDGIYLRTICRYDFYAPDRKFSQKVKFNRNDIRLQERDGMADIKALMAIERAYHASCGNASISQIQEPETIIPSHPQPIIRLKAPILWRDLEE